VFFGQVDAGREAENTCFEATPERLTMINALFVDGNAELLAGLQRDFFSRRNRLNVLVATSVEEALQVASVNAVDIVLTNIRMHGESGAELLSRIQDRQSGSIRVVMSDYDDAAYSHESMPVAHRLLSKPCDVNTLADVIFLTCEWRGRVKSRNVANAMTDVSCLSSDPAVVNEFLEVLNGEPSAAELAAIARRDPALTLKLLQMQSTAFFGPARDASDLKMAISFLRFDVLRQLMSTPGFVRTDESLAPAAAAAVQSVRARCLDAAERAATRSAERGAQEPEVNEAWIMGLLSGAGALATAEFAPDQLGTGGLYEHSAASAYMAHLWGLPTACREALEAFADKRPTNIAFSFAS
jgi:DNA-binding NarL/FixJ family response regulator